ncbi:MAG: phosphatidate cytidylyltransferase, partial [Pseudomonadota bacterium]
MRQRPTSTAAPNELALRLASAFILIPFALCVVWLGGWVLAFACAVFALAMGYEWIRMGASPLMTAHLSAVALPCLVVLWAGPGVSVILLAISAIILAALHPDKKEKSLAAIGLVYTGLMPLGLLMLREGPWDGLSSALLFMAIVWASDSAAYFTGRALGGPRLTRESPSKTWTGAGGAVLVSLLCGALAARITGGPLEVWLLVGGLISFFAQLGDFAESVIKRQYGVKD